MVFLFSFGAWFFSGNIIEYFHLFLCLYWGEFFDLSTCVCVCVRACVCVCVCVCFRYLYLIALLHTFHSLFVSCIITNCVTIILLFVSTLPNKLFFC
jgi:hypothetical protein